MQTSIKNSRLSHLMRVKGLELFSYKGYYATSTEDITSALCMTKDVFELNFKSKKDFFIDVIQNVLLQHTLNLLIGPMTFKRSPFPLILEKLNLEFDRLEESSSFNPIFVLMDFMEEFHEKDDQIYKLLSDTIKIWEVNLTTLIRKAQKDGYVNLHINCEDVASHIISSFFGVRDFLKDWDTTLVREQYIGELNNYFSSISPLQTA